MRRYLCWLLGHEWHRSLAAQVWRCLACGKRLTFEEARQREETQRVKR